MTKDKDTDDGVGKGSVWEAAACVRDTRPHVPAQKGSVDSQLWENTISLHVVIYA